MGIRRKISFIFILYSSQNYDMYTAPLHSLTPFKIHGDTCRSSHSRFLTSDHPSHGDLNYAQSPPSSLIDYHHSTSDSVNDHMNISSFLLEPLPDCSMDSVYSSNSQWIPSPSASHTDMHRCQWPNCNEILRGSSVPCIRRHLHQSKAHLAADAYALADGKVTCLWPDCGKQMKLVSLPKHIANCHLAAGMVKCDRCPAVLSTSDALKRHHEKHCPSVPERKVCAVFLRQRQ